MHLPSYSAIVPYIEKGLVSEQAHPEFPNVRVLNYSKEAQWSKAWDDITTQCRGLVLDVDTGAVLARCMAKFWNLGELDGATPQEDAQVYPGIEWDRAKLRAVRESGELPIITEKLDGSMILMFWLADRWEVATRGSFTSDQAAWARALIADVDLAALDRDYTYVWEAIYPANRIVVGYDFSDLVLLAIRHTATGEEVLGGPLFDALRNDPKRTWRIRKDIPPTDLAALAAMDEPNGEGFVVHYPKAGLRMKIKFPAYVTAHRLVTGLSELSIWEYLRDGRDFDEVMHGVPEEFTAWLTGVRDGLQAKYDEIRDTAIREMEACKYALATNDSPTPPTRKDHALLFARQKYPNLLFSMLDGKDYAEAIWRMIRPHGASSFRTDSDA